jgi:tetratricopeptide (TPR) repeat protein
MAKVSSRVMLIAIVGLLVVVTTSCYQLPGFAEAKLDQAGRYGTQGDFSSCIKITTEIIDQCPSRALAYVVRGAAYRRSGEYSLAIADLDRAIELDPKIADAYTQRAFAWQQGKLNASSKQILDDLNRAIALDAKSALPYILRGNELATLNDHNAAIANYDKALCLNPRSYNALANRASSKMNIGSLDEARRDIRKALALNPPAADRRQIEELFQIVNSREE